MRHLPNILTSLNLAIGAGGIYYTLLVDREQAIYFVLVCAVFDFLDGFTARLLKVKSGFGKELDSLADMVSFGLLPSFFMVSWLQEVSPYYWIGIVIAVFSGLRLAKFNIDDTQSVSFKGLPTPANAIMLTSLVFAGITFHPMLLIAICLVASLLLVSNIPLIALKFEQFTWRGNEWKFVFILLVVLGVTVLQWTFIPLLIPCYLLVSIISNVVGSK